eukprot:4648005-Pyramimonas_sp.AAC.3
MAFWQRSADPHAYLRPAPLYCDGCWLLSRGKLGEQLCPQLHSSFEISIPAIEKLFGSGEYADTALKTAIYTRHRRFVLKDTSL